MVKPEPVHQLDLLEEPAANSDPALSTLTQNSSNDHIETESTGFAAPSMATEQVPPPDNEDLHRMGRGVKELVSAINQLQQLGIEDVAGPTPKVAVIGDQSAGKSSVIEAISGISVPRSDGLCTRCPLQITLVTDEDTDAQWRCTVSLLKNYALVDDAAPTTACLGDDTNEFWPWVKYEPSRTHFASTSDRNLVRDIIAQAQLLTVNPRIGGVVYGAPALSRLGAQVEFSPNVVHIEITGPNIPTLSFYDLPGVFHQTPNSQDAFWVDFVERLTHKYIAEDVHDGEAVMKNSTLILLAVSMESDRATCSAAKLVRDWGAEDRCLGVMTKPDRLPEGEKLLVWERILRGEIYCLGHGYFVTKNPSQAELNQGISHSEARLLEEKYFDASAPWATTFVSFKDRFGTPNLQSALSQKLAAMALSSLPVIHERVQHRLQRIDDELANMPEPPVANAIHTVLERIGALTMTVARKMDGDFPFNDFRVIWMEVRKRFKDAVAAQKPKLRTTGSLDVVVAKQLAGGFRKETAVIDISDDESVHLKPTPTKKRKAENEEASAPVTPRRRSGAPKNRGRASPAMSLDEIKKILDDMSTSDIHGDTDPKAVDHLRKQTLAKWEEPTQIFLDELEELLRASLQQVVDETLSAWKTSGLYRETVKIVLGYLSVHMHEQRVKYAPRLLYLERLKPMTEATAFLKWSVECESRDLQEGRYEARAFAVQNQLEQNGAKPLTGSVEEKKRKLRLDAQLRKDLGDDPYAREVEALAKVRGYYNVASMRYVDNLSQAIQGDVLENFKTKLHVELTTALGVAQADSHETCVRLLAEDGIREIHRFELKEKRSKLCEAMDCLHDLDRKYQRATSELPAYRATGLFNLPNRSSAAPGPSNQAHVEDVMDEA